MGRFHICGLNVSHETSTHTCVVTPWVTSVGLMVNLITISASALLSIVVLSSLPLCPQLQSRSRQTRMGAVQLSPENTWDALGLLHSTESKRGTAGRLSAATLEVICCYRLNATEQNSQMYIFYFYLDPPHPYSTMHWEF